MKTETEIQGDILEALTYHWAVSWVRRYNSANIGISRGGKYRQIQCHRAVKGVKYKQLDIMGMLKNGILFEIEVKTPGEKPDENQYLEIERIKKDGGVAFWADSVESALKQLDAEMDKMQSFRTRCTR